MRSDILWRITLKHANKNNRICCPCFAEDALNCTHENIQLSKIKIMYQSLKFSDAN